MTKHNGIGNAKRSHTKTDSGHPMVYQIRIEGHLNDQWADWFSGLSVSLEEKGDTLLTGPVADQAALFGLLKKIRDLGLPLISIDHINPSSQILRRNEMNEKTQNTADPDGKWIYRVGGLSGIALGIGYLLTIPVVTLYAGGFPPIGTEARLAFFADHAAGWWFATALMVFTDLLYVPFFLALYHALKGLNKYLMLLAFAFAGLFIVLDLAITWTSYPSLIILSGDYAAAATDAQRSLIVATASYPSAIIDSPLSPIYAIFIPALGLLFASLVMRKGSFSKALVYMGMIAGISGILAGIVPIFISDVEMFQYINASLAMIWFFFTGFRLNKLPNK